MSPHVCSEPATFSKFLDAFFTRYPDARFEDLARRALDVLAQDPDEFRGNPAGWAGGLVYALLKWSHDSTNRVLLNGDLESVFGVSIGTIRNRGEQIWQRLESQLGSVLGDNFTLRDEANALCAYAFRNGFLEDIHASTDSDGRPRITDTEMKQLMIEASARLAELLHRKQASATDYAAFIRTYNRMYCRNWER